MDARSATRRTGVFVSYRRADSAGWTGRLVADLRRRFPATQVFMDLNAIGSGQDFVAAIESALASCRVVLVVIGPQWLAANAADAKPRLFAPDDLVHLEVSRALSAPEVHVIPVLVGNARLPGTEELPTALAPLARRQFFELSDTRWDYDVNRLARTLSGYGAVARNRPLTSRYVWATVAAAAFGTVGFLWYSQRQPPSPDSGKQAVSAPIAPKGSREPPSNDGAPTPEVLADNGGADLPKPVNGQGTQATAGTQSTPQDKSAARDSPLPAQTASKDARSPRKDKPAKPAEAGSAAPAAAPALASKLDGDWAGEFVTRRTDRRSREMFSFEVEGSSLHGQNWVEVWEEGATEPTAYGKYPLLGGKVEGETLSFCIQLSHYYDRKHQQYRQCFSGKIRPNEIAFRSLNYLDHPAIPPQEEKFIARRIKRTQAAKR